MAEISAARVKELREITGAGMMECKKALEEADGSIEAAIDILRTRGLAALAKKAGRATNEGAIAAAMTEDWRAAALVEVNCETDFVARNNEFLSFVTTLAETVLANDPADTDALMAAPYGDRGLPVSEALGEAVGKLGENMAIARFVRVAAPEGAVSTYIHGGGRIGVLVVFSLGTPETAGNPSFRACAKDVAMQVAAASPLYPSRDAVPADVIEHELAIYRAQAAESGKPEAIQEKMAQGRLEKFYKEVVLPEQAFVKDMDLTVGRYLEKVGAELGDTIGVARFERWVLGERASS